MEFKKIIERIKKITGLAQKDIAADVFKISDKNLSNKIRRNSVDLDALIKWSGNASVDLNWLLTGKGEPYKSESGLAKTLKETSAGYASRDLDAALLTRIITAIEKELADRALVLDPDKKAEAIALLYELYAETKKEVTKDTIGRYLRLVA